MSNDNTLVIAVLVIGFILLFLVIFYLVFRFAVVPRRRRLAEALRTILEGYSQGQGRLFPSDLFSGMTAELTLWGFPARVVAIDTSDEHSSGPDVFALEIDLEALRPGGAGQGSATHPELDPPRARCARLVHRHQARGMDGEGR